MSKYYVTIGLEMHCEGSETKSKVFSPARNEYSETPNKNVVAIDMGFPGILPTVNKEAVKMAIMMSYVLHARIPEYMYFERKNYYYPDLPKGYQITQNPPEDCVGNGGYVDIEREDGSIFRVDIDNFHLEEDTARSTHINNITAMDYNRACAPLFEMVTKPCIHSADDAVLFLEYIRNVYQYCNISEADSKKGQIRCDVNVSISDDENTLGTKVEVKNVNSFSGVRDTINYEIKRQSDLKDEGRYNEVVQETRRWDEETGTTISMRSKEDLEDYKYFVEPNIPKYKLDPKWLEEIKNSIPELPNERKEKYKSVYGLSNYDAVILVKEKNVSDYFEECLKLGIDAKNASNWITTRILGYINKEFISIDDIYLTPSMLKEIIDMVNSNKISSKQAKDLFYAVLEDKKDPSVLVKELGMEQLSDDKELREIICKILDENTDNIKKYKEGRTNILGFFVGQTMKATGGKANPTMATDIIKEEIERR